MATIAELAQMAENAYSGTASATQSSKLLTGLSGWEVLDTSNSSSSASWNAGYFGVAYYNPTTHEVVIANRGTDWTDGSATIVSNLESDINVALQNSSVAQGDAIAFAQQVLGDLQTLNLSYTSFIETGHSLGGNEAQVAIAYLTDNNILPDSQVSGVVFNSPGIANYDFKQPASSYNVVDVVSQSDIVHLAGGTHLGGAGNQVVIPAGPDQLELLAKLAFDTIKAKGIWDALTAIGGYLFGVVVASHSIAKQIAWLESADGAATGNFDWTSSSSASSIPGSPVDTTAPTFATLPNGAVVMTDPVSNISVTISRGSTGNTLNATFSGGNSAFAQQLAGFGQVSISFSNPGLAFNTFANASVLSETISRDLTDPTGSRFNVVFYAGGTPGPTDPATAVQFSMTVTNPSAIFDYVLPGATQTNIETIDNGPGNGSGNVVVLGTGVTTLTGGGAVAGQNDVWTGTNGEQYVFVPAAPNSTQGTLMITGGVLGTTGNEIIIDNFDVSLAQSANGYFGIQLATTLTLKAGAGSGVALPTVFPAGSLQFYTASINAPESQAQTITFTLSNANPSDFEVVIGDSTVQVGPGGRFTLTLAAGQTSLSFGLLNTTADNGQSDIAAGASLQLIAEMNNPANPAGIPITTAPLTVSYTPETSDTSHAPQTSSVITGQLNPNTQITTYTGDGGNDAIAAGTGAVLINAQNSSDDVISGGSGKDTINGGSGNDVTNLSGSNDLLNLGSGFNTVNGGSGQDTIFANGGNAIIIANGGTDLIFGGNGTNEIYANTQVSLADAIAQTQAAGATSGQGDLLSALNGNNTVIGGKGNDLVEVGSGQDIIVLGSGNDTFLGGEDLTNAQANWTTSNDPISGGFFSLTVSNVTSTAPGFTDPYPQPYGGNVDVGTGNFLGTANDTVFTGNGNDLLVLGNGTSYVQLGSGSDTVWNGVGNDTIIAGTGADLIFGGGGNTYIVGGSGADTIWGGDGNNIIYGGSGNSTILAAHGPGGINYANAGLEQNYVFGGSGNDLIQGSGGNDTLIAGSGNTTIVGQSGNENIVGGSGNDLLQAGSGNATIDAGGAGRDTLIGGNSSLGSYILYGGNGVDVLNGGSGANLIYAGDGGVAGAATTVFASQSDSMSSTTIYGGSGVDFLEGGVGTSVIFAGDGGTSVAPTNVLGGSGNDTIYGGPGLDFIQGGSGTNLLYAGGGGTDATPDSVLGGTGISTLYGGEGASLLQDLQSGQDLLVSESADDSMIGMGNDTLVAGTGNDLLQANGGSVTFVFNAGFGQDTVHTIGATENIVFGAGVELADMAATFGTDSNGNWYLNLNDGADGESVDIQNAFTGGLGTVTFADTGTISTQALLQDVFGQDQDATQGSNNLWLSLNNNELITPGNFQDTISSWGSGSTLVGGTGNSNPTFIYSAGSAAHIINGQGVDSIVAAGSNSSIIGGANGTFATVTGANAMVTGTTGHDVITLSGVDDTVVAGTGNSEFLVNDSSAVIVAGAGVGVDTIVSSVSYTLPTNVNILTLTGTAALSATGNAGNDSLSGGAGNDTLVAGSGVDTLTGGTGNTTFVINSTSDVVQDSSTTANNQIDSSVSYTLPTDVNTLVLTGTSGLIAKANNGNDTLVSNSGIDTLIGGSGNDTFIVSNSADVIELGTGTTTIIYESSAGYTLPAGALTLTLTGTANLVGTADGGNDTLVSNSGVDTLYGGSGNDTFVINNSADVVVDTLTTTSNTIQSSVNFSLPTDVNTLILTGTAALVGTGNAATDVLQANSGNDTLVSGAGLTTLVAGAGSDTFVVNNTGDVIQGVVQGTHDTVVSSVNYSLLANIDTLALTGTANVVGTANSDADTLISNSGVDTLVGGSNNETYVINNSGDVIQDHSPFEESVVETSVNYTLTANVGTLILSGTGNIIGTVAGPTDVTVMGGAGQDTLVADSAFETLEAGTGVATLVGAGTFELFVVNNTADVVSLAGGAFGTDTIQSSVSYTLGSGVGTLQLTGSADLIGTAANSGTLIANAGNDILYAGSGLDTLVAGAGVDTLVGGNGTDTFVVNSTADVLQGVSTIPGNAIVASISYTLPTNINILTLSGYDNLVGVGNDGSDVLTGGSGNDTLVAGSGPTTLVAGAGNDLFILGNSADVVENTNTGQQAFADSIESSFNYTLPTAVNILVLTGTGNLTATGNLAADLIVGNAGLDTLNAGLGNDTLVAGTGLAVLVGGQGNDTFVIDNTGDAILDPAAGENNILVSSVSYSLPTNVNTLLLSGSANLVATANAGNDSITGNAGADTLSAGAGNDTLVAGSGAATLIGGSGNDTFVVNSSADVIEDSVTGGANVVLSSVSFVLPTNVNELVLTSAANIAATGNAANDVLVGGVGNDTLIAGSAVDTLAGGSGNTVFVVDNTGDVVTDSFATAVNQIQASVNYALPTDVNTLILTGSGNLSGVANSGSDTLVSNSGVDTFTGGTGVDTFIVNNSADVLLVSSSTNSDVVMSSVNYVLPSNLALLTLNGTAALVGTANGGNDTLISNSGADTLVGGAGNDTFLVSNVADVVQDTSTTATNIILSSVNYSLPTNVNALTLTGTAALLATGNGGSDVIRANSGNDTLVAGAGAATLVGGSGADLFVLDSTADVVQVSATVLNDTVQSSVSYTLPMASGVLQLTGTSNLVGKAGSGSDTLISNNGIDTLIAGAGPDLIVVNNSSDVIQNLVAGDTVESSSSYTLTVRGGLTLLGTADITATGAASGDVLTAGAGDDTLVAETANQTLVGGTGNDVFVVSDPTDVVVDNSGSSNNVILSSVSFTLPQNVDSLTLTGSGYAVIAGNDDNNNVLTGNAGVDTIIGTALNDTLTGDTGSALLGNGVIYGGPGTNLIYAGDGGFEYVYGNSSLTGFFTQSTIYGGAGDDFLYGGSGRDVIETGTGEGEAHAGSGFETLIGTNGTNELFGGAGIDVIYGGNGTSDIFGGSGSSLVYAGNGGTMFAPAIIQMGSNGADANSRSTVYGGTGTDAIYGGPGSDLITTGSGFEWVFAGSGSETINGGSGTNYLYGGSGSSLIYAGSGTVLIGVGSGSNVIYAGNGGTSSDVEFVAGSFGSSATTRSTIYGGSGYDLLEGGIGSDLIVTGSGISTVQGGSGAETLNGAVGENQLLGGSGTNLIYGGAGTYYIEGGSGTNVIYAGAGGETYGLNVLADIGNGTAHSTVFGGSGTAVLAAGGGTDLIYGGTGAETLSSGTSGSTTLVAGTGTTVMRTANSGSGTTLYVINDNFSQVTVDSAATENVLLGTGIEPDDFTISLAQTGNSGSVSSDLSVVLTDGSQSIAFQDGMDPSVAITLNFSDTGPMSLAQLIALDGTGTTVLTETNGNGVVLSTNDSQSIAAASSIVGVYSYGSGDTITSVGNGTVIDAYGNDDTISGANLWIGGSGDSIELFQRGAATITGAGTTVVGAGGNEYTVYQTNTVIQEAADSTAGSEVIAYANYTLPVNVQYLALEGNGLVATSNAQGGELDAFGNGDTLIGGSGADTLIAYGNNDVIVGGSGAETYILSNTSDSVVFGTGATGGGSLQVNGSYTLPNSVDTLIEDASNATAVGNSGNDLIVGKGTDDVLVAGSGNDTLADSVFGNADTLVGGAGSDTFEIESTRDVILSASTANNVVVSEVSYSLPTNINTLVLNEESGLVGQANAANDSLVANTFVDTLLGGSGADTLVIGRSFTGEDVLVAGTGNDVLEDQSNSADANTLEFNSGFGNDLVAQLGAGPAGDILEFGAGLSTSNLTFTALPGSNGSAPSLVITGSGHSVTVQGGLTPGAISEVMFAGGTTTTVQQLLDPGADVTVQGANGNLILSSVADDVITGGTGEDTVLAWGSGDTLTAGAQSTLIYAVGADDSVIGGTGADTIVVDSSNDTLTPGSGNEAFFINDQTESTVIQATGGSIGNDTVYTTAYFSLPSNISILTAIGTNGVELWGNSGNDVITGNGGPDTLVSGSGVDTLVGGTWRNVFLVNNSADVVEDTVSFDTISSSVSYSLPSSVNILVMSGSGNVAATGNSNNDVIIANFGNDLLTAGSGDDTLEAYNNGFNTIGVVTLVGGSGADSLYGYVGSPGDVLISGTGVDTLDAGQLQTLVINNSADVLQLNTGGQSPFETIESSVSYTFANGIVTGGPGTSASRIDWILTGTNGLYADAGLNGGIFTIQGNAGADTLIGGAGNNDLIAGTGVDTLIGGGPGSFNDFKINNTADVIIDPTGANDEIDASVNYTLPGFINNLDLLTAGIQGTGSSNNVYLEADGGSDTLVAGSGNDTLVSGSTAANTLVGGSGTDQFTIHAVDTVLLNSGFGNSQVSVTGATGTPTVDFGAGVTATSLTAYATLDSSGRAALAISGPTGTVTLDGALAGQAYQFKFNGGSALTLAQFLAEVNVEDSTVAGGTGNVILVGDRSAVLTGGSGNDTIYAAGAGDVITGGSGNQLLVALGTGDSITGGSASDTLSGLGANDILTAGTAADTLIGGTGVTVEFVINSSSDAIQLQSSPGADTVASSVNFSLPASITTLILTAAGVKGTANSTGTDTLISSTAGIDTLAGASGSETFVLNFSGDVVTDSSTSAHNTVEAGFSYSLPTDVNTLILTGSAAVTGTTNTAADLIIGNLGTDTLTATSTTAATTLEGGGGNNTFNVASTKDVVIETFTGANDLIVSTVTYSLPPGVSALTLSGTAALQATGGTQNSVLTAAATGTDTLAAGSGLATLNGGGGNDIFVVNNTGDVVNVTATGVTDTIESTVNYVLPANVVKLTLEGGALALSAGTTNSLNDTLTANSGNDTLIAGVSGADSLVGGSGADLFIIDNTADVVSVGTTHGFDTIQSSVNVTAPANVANITLTGTGPLSATGSATQAGVLTAGGGNDTLTALDSLAGSGATLVGGAGSDVFSINNVADVITDTYTSTTNTLMSSVSFTLPTNVNILTVTGTSAVLEQGNAANDSMTGNNAADTLVAGNGTDTLVSGTGVESLVGGTGTDIFFVNNASDIVSVAGGGAGNDTISSSVSFTLSANVQYLTLTGTGTVSGTGNSLTDLIVANTGTDTLTGGTGVAVLEGGTGTVAHDTLKAPSAQAALIAGSGTSTLTGGAFKDFYAAAGTSQTITTGATANVIAINKGDGATTIAPTTGATDVLSLGAGIDTESLTFSKSGTANLILSDGAGDSITFTNWFTSTNNQDVKTLQVVEQASASYNPSGTDSLRNKPIEEFNFTTLVADFTLAGSVANWPLSTDMAAAALTSSTTAAYGGDLAYYFGLNGNLTGMDLSAAQSTLTNTSYATALQTIDSFASISGGSGIHLLAEQPVATYVDPVQLQWMSADTDIGASTTGLTGSEAEPDAPSDAVTTLLASTPNTPQPRRTIDTPRMYMA